MYLLILFEDLGFASQLLVGWYDVIISYMLFNFFI